MAPRYRSAAVDTSSYRSLAGVVMAALPSALWTLPAAVALAYLPHCVKIYLVGTTHEKVGPP
jgi:hypothetical protein